MGDTLKQVESKVAEIMELLEIPKDDNNDRTPYRIAKMLCNEIFENRNNKGIYEFSKSICTFPFFHPGNCDPIIVKDIPFSSTCAHHWMPFFGTVTVSYVPDAHIVGLSKIPRIVRYFSKMPQLQEYLGRDIALFLAKKVNPKSVTVTIKAKHTCVMCRGAESDCETETVYTHTLGKGYLDEKGRFHCEN